jgi:hypothetical protein
LENLDGENSAPEIDLPVKLRWKLLGDGEDIENVDVYPIPVHELAILDGEASALADGEANAAAADAE